VYPAGERHWLPLRHDLFGLTNYAGAVGALLLMLLLATSNDAMLRRLGTPGWKRLQRWNYAVFALVAAHTLGFMEIEHQKAGFVVTAVVGLAMTVVLQAAGYWSRRASGGKR
jgi:sulfoxide reductase heme-binding subunit YedZ